MGQAGIVEQILKATARQMSMGLQPIAELQPTDTVSSFSNTIAANASGTVGIPFQFPSDGLAVGIRVNVADGTSLSFSSTLLRVQIDGDTELFPSASGGGAGFLSFSQISGNSSFLGRYLFRREFKQATFWQIFVQNRQNAQIVCDIAIDIVRTSNLRTG